MSHVTPAALAYAAVATPQHHRKKKTDNIDCVKDFYATIIAKRRASHGLKHFIIQSDSGECKSEAVVSELRTCCAYTLETMAFIERLWGIINSMATAILFDKGLLRLIRIFLIT